MQTASSLATAEQSRLNIPGWKTDENLKRGEFWLAP
jgi:hypothetical protein